MDRLFLLAHMSKGAAPDAPPRDLGKEALDLIEPTGAGRREVQMVAGVPGKPALHPGVLCVP